MAINHRLLSVHVAVLFMVCGLLSVLAMGTAACNGQRAEPGVQQEVQMPTSEGPGPGEQPEDDPATAEEAPPAESIGMATMRDDGTIVLQLRAEGPSGIIGDGRMEYPPSHARYQYILDHLGGLTPGEQKPVPPFPG